MPTETPIVPQHDETECDCAVTSFCTLLPEADNSKGGLSNWPACGSGLALGDRPLLFPCSRNGDGDRAAMRTGRAWFPWKAATMVGKCLLTTVDSTRKLSNRCSMTHVAQDTGLLLPHRKVELQGKLKPKLHGGRKRTIETKTIFQLDSYLQSTHTGLPVDKLN